MEIENRVGRQHLPRLDHLQFLPSVKMTEARKQIGLDASVAIPDAASDYENYHFDRVPGSGLARSRLNRMGI